jgi:hypothetical protein
MGANYSVEPWSSIATTPSCASSEISGAAFRTLRTRYQRRIAGNASVSFSASETPCAIRQVASAVASDDRYLSLATDFVTEVEPRHCLAIPSLQAADIGSLFEVLRRELRKTMSKVMLTLHDVMYKLHIVEWR